MADFDAHSLLQKKPAELLPFLQQTLILQHAAGSLPELIGFVGVEKLRDLLLTFEGQTFKVPSWESVESSVKDAYLLWKLAEMTPCNAVSTKKELCELFEGFSWEAVQSRAMSLRKMLGT